MKHTLNSTIKPTLTLLAALLLAPLAVLMAAGPVTNEDGLKPSVITNPGAEFQDNARPGAMVLGMDRTPKGRIWGCWTGNEVCITVEKLDSPHCVAMVSLL